MPFFDRDEHSSLNSATRNDLWTLFEGDFEHLAKPSFCVLHLPCSQIATSTRCYFSIRLVRTLVKVSIALEMLRGGAHGAGIGAGASVLPVAQQLSHVNWPL